MHINSLVRILKKQIKRLPAPLSDQVVAEYGKDPFLLLVACLLSLRARDVVTITLVRTLFALVRTPQQLLALPHAELEKIIFKSGFYRTKAKVLREVSKTIIERYNGRVPRTAQELLTIKGVGPKTANLVVGVAFGKPAICVDTHVHRVSNRLGIIKTKTVEQTEEALAHVLPRRYWLDWNKLLVVWGQNICSPQSPWCSRCAVRALCKRVGVTKSR